MIDFFKIINNRFTNKKNGSTIYVTKIIIGSGGVDIYTDNDTIITLDRFLTDYHE